MARLCRFDQPRNQTQLYIFSLYANLLVGLIAETILKLHLSMCFRLLHCCVSDQVTNSSDGKVKKACASGAVDSGLIPCRVKPITSLLWYSQLVKAFIAFAHSYLLLLLLLLVGGGAKEEQQRLNLSGTLCRPSIRPITIFHRFFFCFFVLFRLVYWPYSASLPACCKYLASRFIFSFCTTDFIVVFSLPNTFLRRAW